MSRTTDPTTQCHILKDLNLGLCHYHTVTMPGLCTAFQLAIGGCTAMKHQHTKSIFFVNETAGHENQKIIICEKFKHITQVGVFAIMNLSSAYLKSNYTPKYAHIA
jgi:hypothetical protein